MLSWKIDWSWLIGLSLETLTQFLRMVNNIWAMRLQKKSVFLCAEIWNFSKIKYQGIGAIHEINKIDVKYPLQYFSNLNTTSANTTLQPGCILLYYWQDAESFLFQTTTHKKKTYKIIWLLHRKSFFPSSERLYIRNGKHLKKKHRIALISLPCHRTSCLH